MRISETCGHGITAPIAVNIQSVNCYNLLQLGQCLRHSVIIADRFRPSIGGNLRELAASPWRPYGQPAASPWPASRDAGSQPVASPWPARGQPVAGIKGRIKGQPARHEKNRYLQTRGHNSRPARRGQPMASPPWHCLSLCDPYAARPAARL